MFVRVVSLAALTALSFGPVAWAENAVHPGATAQKAPAVIMDAGPVTKVYLLLMLIAAVVALVLGVIALRRRGRPIAGQAFVSSLRLGAVVLSAALAVYHVANIMVRFHYDGGVPPFHIVSPGVAEIALVIVAGLLASAAAIFAHGWMGRAALD